MNWREPLYRELDRARSMHGKLHSKHEALAVIREEYLEVEKEAFWPTDDDHLRMELLQLAAMCIRAIEDLELCTA